MGGGGCLRPSIWTDTIFKNSDSPFKSYRVRFSKKFTFTIEKKYCPCSSRLSSCFLQADRIQLKSVVGKIPARKVVQVLVYSGAVIGTVRYLCSDSHDARFASIGEAEQRVKCGLRVLLGSHCGPLSQFPHPSIAHFMRLKNNIN
jgi:hypothetical protein